jgi:hypothetical protein
MTPPRRKLNDIQIYRGPIEWCGLVWEMENSSGWKRIKGDFGKF